MHLKVRNTDAINTTTNDSLKNYNDDHRNRWILQIFDVSHKLLYDDIKAEYDFHSMINATVSHELRNPLNSMICQLESMNHNLRALEKVKNAI